ncbi:MAG: hypothetical protein LiPW30_769 [Parcubacteria group bacterium LiPW_30]|nr:MAG: hypothetical protein LiPW30_769 [Parcubacteria group bacterium LiPW_30]
MFNLKNPVAIFFESLKLGLKIEWLILVQVWKVICQCEELRPGITIALLIGVLSSGGVLACLGTFCLYGYTGKKDIGTALLLLPYFLIVIISVGYWLCRKENPWLRDILNLLAYLQKLLGPWNTLPARSYSVIKVARSVIVQKVQQVITKLKKFFPLCSWNTLLARSYSAIKVARSVIVQKIQQVIAKLKKFFS